MTNKIQKPRPLILTIDNDDMIRLMLKDILSREGFKIFGAANGQTGLEVLIKLARSRLKMSSNLSFSTDMAVIVQKYFYNRRRYQLRNLANLFGNINNRERMI